MRLATASLLAGATLFAASLAAQTPQTPQTSTPAQPELSWPERIQNRQMLPAEIGGDRLRGIMVGFSRSLGVRCTHCHVGAEGAPLSAIDFVSDANPRKNIARGMLRMVTRINRELVPEVPGLTDPVSVTCYTCHRGATEPAFRVPAPAEPAPTAALRQPPQ